MRQTVFAVNETDQHCQSQGRAQSGGFHFVFCRVVCGSYSKSIRQLLSTVMSLLRHSTLPSIVANVQLRFSLLRQLVCNEGLGNTITRIHLFFYSKRFHQNLPYSLLLDIQFSSYPGSKTSIIPHQSPHFFDFVI